MKQVVLIIFLLSGICVNYGQTFNSKLANGFNEKWISDEGFQHRGGSDIGIISLNDKNLNNWVSLKDGVRLTKNKNATDKLTTYKPSLVFIDDSTRRITFTYDISGNVLTKLVEVSEESVWVNGSRETYTYNSSGNMLTSLIENWDSDAWVGYKLITYTYTESGILTSIIEQRWGTDSWYNNKKETFEIDASGNVAINTRYMWGGESWMNYARRIFTYNAAQQILSIVYYNWQNEAWADLQRMVFTYDAFGNRITELFENFENGVWNNYGRINYTFNEANLVILIFEEFWGVAGWENFTKSTIDYDQYGNLSYYLKQEWLSGEWKNSYRRTAVFNTIGFVLTDMEEYWENNVWEPYFKHTYTYDQQENLTSTLAEEYVDGAFVNNWSVNYEYDAFGNGIKAEYFDWDVNTWITGVGSITLFYNNKIDNLSYYCSNVMAEYIEITDVDDDEYLPVSFALSQNYPNPFNPNTTINFSLPVTEFVTLKVYDILGKEVTTLINEELLAGSHIKIWNAGNFSSGVYFYKLQAGKFVSTKKMVLMK